VITKSLVRMEGCDVKFTPQLADGKITFLAEIFERLGEDKSGKLALAEEFNVVSKPTLVEQGPLINEFAAIGSGSTWGEERQASVFEVAESRRRYGLRQDSTIYSSVTEQMTLDRHASEEAQRMSRGATRLSLEAANKAPALFSQYDIGDELRCQLPSYDWHGYDEAVRVMTREHDPNVQGRCALVVEEKTAWLAAYTGTGVTNTEEL